jgi:hypothetical protein
MNDPNRPTVRPTHHSARTRIAIAALIVLLVVIAAVLAAAALAVLFQHLTS